MYAASAVCAQFFPIVTDWFQKHFGSVGPSYLVFASICAACVVFVWRFVPETKGLTLEKIADFWLHYHKENSAR
jgi:hypothetical protein